MLPNDLLQVWDGTVQRMLIIIWDVFYNTVSNLLYVVSCIFTELVVGRHKGRRYGKVQNQTNHYLCSSCKKGYGSFYSVDKRSSTIISVINPLLYTYYVKVLNPLSSGSSWSLFRSQVPTVTKVSWNPHSCTRERRLGESVEERGG